MNERIRYAYTYFLHPFQVKNRKKYLAGLIANKNIQIKLFEKEKDIDLYSYFSNDAKKEFFESFELEKAKRIQIEKMTNNQKINYFSKQKTVYLEYNNSQSFPAKLGEEDGIFFNIEKIEIICFSTGMCFLVMKVQIEDISEFSQILDFNYKFKKINSGNYELKGYESIKIQTNSFENAEEMLQFINLLTTKYSKEKEMFVYSYICIDSEDWQEKQDTEIIQDNYQKLINVRRSQDKEKLLYGNLIYETNYIQVAMSKTGLGVIASSKEDFNYTKLPYYFERQYLYTFIIGLYKKENIMQNIISSNLEINITEDELGIELLKGINKEFQLTKRYENAKQNYQIQQQKKNKQINQILLVILGISIICNFVNLWILLNMLNR